MASLMFVVAITMVSSFTSAVGTGEQDDGNLTCFNCAGEVGDVYSNCGEVIPPDADLNTVNCTGFCKKQVQYFIDQKIRVERNCTDDCVEGCTMERGTSTCVQCCQTDRCNSAVQLWRTSLILTSIGFIVMTIVAT